MILTMPGCPIRKPSDQSLLGGSPKFIAAIHVLHRSLVPRHPPYALNSLNIGSSMLKAKSKSIAINVACSLNCRIVSFNYREMPKYLSKLTPQWDAKLLGILV